MHRFCVVLILPTQSIPATCCTSSAYGQGQGQRCTVSVAFESVYYGYSQGHGWPPGISYDGVMISFSKHLKQRRNHAASSAYFSVLYILSDHIFLPYLTWYDHSRDMYSTS